MYSYEHPHIDQFAGRSVLETAVIAIGITVLWFVAVVVAIAAATAVGEGPLVTFSVMVIVGLAVVVVVGAAASRVERSIADRVGYSND